MGSLQFNKTNGNLKRVLPGFDHYSGLMFYSNTLPSGFSTSNRIKLIADITAAETLGITANNASVLIKLMHYHISETFRMLPETILYVGIFAEPAVDAELTFDEIDTMRIFANGKLRQIGVWTKEDYDEAHIALLQGKYDAAFNVFAPLEIFYSPSFVGVADEDMPDLETLTGVNVHLVIAQDGAALGSVLATVGTYSIGAIGAAVGTIAASKVCENMGWVDKFNLAVPGGELDVPALANGTLISDLPENYIYGTVDNPSILDARRLIFIKKYSGYTGSYWNDSHSASPADSDYAYAEDNRTIDKAIRGCYQYLLPQVNGTVLLDKDTGKLSFEFITFLQLQAGKALEQMEKDGELSGFTVTIDPDQDVNATSKIVFTISNGKIAISRDLLVNIGYQSKQ